MGKCGTCGGKGWTLAGENQWPEACHCLIAKEIDCVDHDESEDGVEPWVFGAEVIDEESPEYVALRRAAS